MFPPHLAMSGQAKPLGNVHPAGQKKKIFSEVGWWWGQCLLRLAGQRYPKNKRIPHIKMKC